MDLVLNFTHLIFVGFFALFPPINPLGTALVMDPLLHGLDPKARKAASSRIALYCFIICSGTLLVGSWIFSLFGISMPVVQLAGGILICKMGWQLLSSDEAGKDSQSASAPLQTSKNIEGVLFYPLAFPMTTGAGTISVLLTLSAHTNVKEDWFNYFINLTALFTAVILMCVLIYLSYAYTPTLLRKLGPRGGPIVNRLSAFLVFCVGLQIAVEGLRHLFPSLWSHG